MRKIVLAAIYTVVVALVAVVVARNQAPADSLPTGLLALFVWMLGSMLITGWGFKKGYRTDVQCVSCYQYRMLPSGADTLRCDNCGNGQEDTPFIVDRVQPPRPA